nr:hypothetical protein Q903MT_gene3573 [Picea sitchensis]
MKPILTDQVAYRLPLTDQVASSNGEKESSKGSSSIASSRIAGLQQRGMADKNPFRAYKDSLLTVNVH